jgi:hypothetical protein
MKGYCMVVQCARRVAWGALMCVLAWAGTAGSASAQGS